MSAIALLDDLLPCERGVWEALAAGDAGADEAALAVDFPGVYPDRFAGREGHIASLHGGPSVARFALSELRVLELGPAHALLAYRAVCCRTGSGQTGTMSGSRVWRRCDAGWENVFSQVTPVSGQPVQ